MNMIVHYPKYFAAAYPVCEAYTNDALTDEMVESIKDMPIWFTHAKNDPTVKIGTIDEDGNFVSTSHCLTMYTTPQVSTREQTAHRISTTDTGHGSTL